jgi:hypothetical protein
MLAEIYLLQLELATQTSEKSVTTPDYDFVPFSLDAFIAEKARVAAKHERPRLKLVGA